MPEAARRRRGLSPGWFIGLAAGIGLGIAPGPVLLLGVLLGPGCIMSLLEARGQRSTPMLLFGAAGAVAPCLALIRAGFWLDTAVTLVSEPSVLAGAWLPALLGWGMAQLMPEMVLILLSAQMRSRVATLRKQRARLGADWNLGEN
jgi:hypothetical protein